MTCEASARSARPDDPSPRAVPAGRGLPANRGARFGLFGEVLTVGLAVSVLSLPVITVLPAMAAGAEHLRQHVEARPDSLGDLWQAFVAACRGVWLVALGAFALFGLLVLNIELAGTVALPGATGVTVASAVLAAALSVVLLRAAAAWELGARWTDVVRTSARRARTDLFGSFMLVVALGLCAVMVWMLFALAVVVPGLMVLAVVAIERRGSL
ncbi:MAG TPA: hypothetical protein VFC48_10035 [Cellulomonas sp.]|nr:hypothetical protein [Cellulomonas sp.]